MAPLDEADLAYMREVQGEHRPTEAELARKAVTRTPTGGTAATWGAGQPVLVRIKSAPDRIPPVLAERYGQAGLAKITMDLAVDVRAGDRLTVSTDPATAEVYELVTDGQPDDWSTAQQVWGHRTAYPARA